MADFHFLRPAWLLVLLLAPVVLLLLHRAGRSDSGWSRVIPPALLHALIPGGQGPVRSSRGLSRFAPPWLLALFALITLSLALAGPAWRQAPTPLKQQNDSLVIVLDLSLSMLANDVQPDRLTQAKRKIRDILQAREGSLTGLVVFAADAHVVSPLTDDRRTIEGMLEALDPVMMPAQGNRADLGIARGLELLQQGAPEHGRLLLIGDDVPSRYQAAIHNLLRETPFLLNTLVTGTEAGGPMPLAKRGFIRDDNGNIVVTRASPEAMTAVASANGGAGHLLTLDDRDIRALRLRAADGDRWQESARDLTVNRWQDDGYWLLWLPAAIALVLWRRGTLLVLLALVLPLSPRNAMAWDWADLWQRPDQRAEALIQDDPRAAASRLDNTDWRGTALYRAEDFDAAVEAFAKGTSADAHYNRGNALARSGKLADAITAYEQALASSPDHEDARFNRDLVKKLLEQQQQNGDGQDKNNQKSKKQDQDQDPQQSGSGKQSSDGDQSNPDQTEGGDPSAGNNQQQDSEQQNSQQPDEEQDQQGDEAGESQSEQTGQPDSQKGQSQTASQAGEPRALEPGELSQGQEQALRRIPDDPGGLLRRKFMQQYQERNTQPDEGDTPW